MSKESYIRGFCKTASAAGIDPRVLAAYIEKTAQATAASSLPPRPMPAPATGRSNAGSVSKPGVQKRYPITPEGLRFDPSTGRYRKAFPDWNLGEALVVGALLGASNSLNKTKAAPKPSAAARTPNPPRRVAPVASKQGL